MKTNVALPKHRLDAQVMHKKIQVEGKNWGQTTRRGGNHHRKRGSTNTYFGNKSKLNFNSRTFFTLLVLLWGQLADVVITVSVTTTVRTIIKWFKVTEAASLSSSNFIYQNQRLPAVPTCVSWPDTHPHNDPDVCFSAGVFVSSSRSFSSSVVVSFKGNKKTSCHLQHGTAVPNATYYWSECFTVGVFSRSFLFIWITFGYCHGNNWVHSQHQ